MSGISYEGKTIALVGPSRNTLGSGKGAEIEGFDLVARMNHQWPIPTQLTADIGSRMDVLFHCCNQDYPVSRFAVAEFADTKMVFYENGLEAEVMRTICRELGVPAVDVTATYQALRSDLGTFPTTGLVAIARLLSLPIRALKIFGMTFGREPYYPGYLGHGAAPENWIGDRPARNPWRHDMERELNLFRDRFAADPRLQIDGPSASIMMYRDANTR